MATPVNTDCETLDYTYYGMPFAGYDADSDVNSMTLDYTYYGMPFALNAYGTVVADTFFIYTVVS